MPTQVRITYLDTAMALIEAGSVRLLTDPVFDPRGTTFDHGPVHLEKTSSTSITPEALGRIDAVLLSHQQHGDNLDQAGRDFLPAAKHVLTTPESAAQLTSGNAIGLAPWAQTIVESPDGEHVTITATPAQHGPDGTQAITGEVTGFLIEGPGLEGRSIYISGDTIRFSGTEEIARRCAPVGIALLHIGRVQLEPMGDLVFSLSAAEAGAYAESLQAKAVVPLHFEGWRHFAETEIEARQAFGHSSVAGRVHWLTLGQAITFDI